MSEQAALDRQLLLDLIDASLEANPSRVREMVREVSLAFDGGGNKALAKSIRTLIRQRGAGLEASRQPPRLPADPTTRLPLVEEHAEPTTTPPFLGAKAAGVLDTFVEDSRHSSVLSENGLTPRLFMILSGPPGTGKSLLAGHAAERLGRPLLLARLDSLISSRLGDTAKNIREVFDYVGRRRGALFLDEMDAIAKLRDDRMELGELKRVVNTVIQCMDALPEETVVIGATNHPQMLDTAIWRRFPYSIELGLPDVEVRRRLWTHFLPGDAEAAARAALFATLSEGLSGADIEVLALAARRHALLDAKPLDVTALVDATLGASEGKPGMPARGDIGTARRKALARELVGRFGLTKVDTAKLLGVSRPIIHRYLKD